MIIKNVTSTKFWGSNLLDADFKVFLAFYGVATNLGKLKL